jgi:acyl-CoA reductase-like NAD-dependent aldehyde dehydrogenase
LHELHDIEGVETSMASKPATLPQLIVGADRVSGAGEVDIDVNPATGEDIAAVAAASPAQVDAAVQAARAALGGPWGEMDGFTRRRLLNRFADAVAARAADIGAAATADMGQPLGFAVGEAIAASDYLAYYAGWADKLAGDTLTTPLTHAHVYTYREPVGVVAAIVAWNSPTMLTAFKLGPALAAGCTVVLKPSELAPFAPLLVAEAALDAGLPPGVVNVVLGGAATGAALVSHPDVDKITFTGGGRVARQVAEEAAASCKRLTLELGGKSANIVFEDADLAAAAAGACQGVFLLAGQQCVAGSRVLVHRRVLDDFVDRLIAGAKEWTVGDPHAPDTRVGPLISAQALARVETFVDEAKAGGGEVVCGGARLDGPLAAGWFYPPTVITGIGNDARLCREEIFGPVAAVVPFDSEAEAVSLANDTRFGLAGGVWTRDLSRAHRVARAVRAGTMWVNCYTAVTPGAPFGGVGLSGIGREGGVEGLHDFTEVKTVYVADVFGHPKDNA